MSELTDGKRTELYQEKPGGQFKEGNPGRPKGALGFSTKWKLFIDKVAKDKDVEFDDVERELLAVGFDKAKSGDYQFYKDIFDRNYGRAQSTMDVTTDGEKIQGVVILPEIKEE